MLSMFWRSLLYEPTGIFMSPSETVSIIMPSYNQGYCIEKAINSFIQQDYPSKELIIIDGGSQDNTLGILQKYQAHIHYWVSEPDQGIYDAMNKGIEQAQGDWLYFLGTDDALNDQVLSSIFESEVSLNYDLLYGNILHYNNGKGRYWGDFSKEQFRSINICHQAIFYRKTLFEQLGNFNLKYKALADWAFNIQCFGLPNIRTKYLNLDIAYYKVGGFSAQFFDSPFFADQAGLLNKYLHLTISPKEIYSTLDKLIFHEIHQGSLKKGLKTASQAARFTGKYKFYFQNALYYLLKRYGLR